MPTAPSKPPLSAIRFAGDVAYISGQLPRNADGAIIAGDMVAQTRQSLSNLRQILESNNLTLADVVKVTAWLTDAALMNDFNAAYREFFAAPFPARSVVVSALVAPGAVVEIEAVASR